MKKIIFLLLSILICMPGTARRVEVRIMSYNIRHTGEKSDTGVKHWDARKFATINMIRTEKPDVIGMQEVRSDQKEYLVAELPEYQGVMESMAVCVERKPLQHMPIAVKTAMAFPSRMPAALKVGRRF